MASAVLTTRNEQNWGENRVYMRKYTNNFTNNNPNPNPSPNLTRFNSNSNPKPRPFVRHGYEQLLNSVSPVMSNDSSIKSKGTNSKLDESCKNRYVTFRIGSYTRRELKGLKNRLILDLNRVRTLRHRIESTDHNVSHFSVRSPVPAVPAADVAVKEKKGISISKGKTNDRNIIGQKRAMPFSTGGVAKRPTAKANIMRKCGQILTKLMKHKHGWVFNSPVDVVALGLHDYHMIIRNPMDLGTIKSKLGKNEYDSPVPFASDVKLTFTNAMIYNPKGSDVHVMAQTLLSLFEKMFNSAYEKLETENGQVVGSDKVEVPVVAEKARSDTNAVVVLNKPNTISTPQLPALPCPPPAMKPAGKQPVKMGKLKDRNLNKREMTFDEKNKLAMSLSNLPQGPDGMDQIMPIIKKQFSAVGSDEEEIELDMDVLDNETLWELDGLIAKFNTKAAAAVAKTRTDGVIDNLVSALQADNQFPAIEQHQEQMGKKGDVGEEDVDIGEEIPVSNFPSVEIEKNVVNDGGSGRSSSSSSASDSSSSDSGSSSGCDSDTAHSPTTQGEVASPF